MKNQEFDLQHTIEPGRHFYQFYKGLDDYMEVMVLYFKAGLEKGQACLWIVSEKKDLNKVSSMAKTLIPDAEKYLNSGQFQIRSGEEWYLKDGHFDEDQAVQNVTQYVQEMTEKGYGIVRGSGDAASIPRSDWQLVQHYEKNMGPWIKDNPIIGLCAYPILDCSLTETKSVLECHDDVLVHHL